MRKARPSRQGAAMICTPMDRRLIVARSRLQKKGMVTGKPQQTRLSSVFQSGKGNRAKVRISALLGALSAALNFGEVATTPPPYACVFPMQQGRISSLHA